MRRHVDKLVLLALLALLALLVHEHTRLSVAATARAAHRPAIGAPTALDRGGTKFDLLFREPELALP